MTLPQDLLSILKTRREYCRAMLALAEHQKTLIQNNRTTELIQLLAQKQRVLDGLMRLNELEAGWKQSGQAMDACQSAEAAMIQAEADTIYAQIRSIEQEGASELIRRRDAIQNKLRELGEVTHALPAGHLDGDGPRSMFLDVSR